MKMKECAIGSVVIFGIIVQPLFAVDLTISLPNQGTSRGKTATVTGSGFTDSNAVANTVSFAFGTGTSPFNAENEHSATVVQVMGNTYKWDWDLAPPSDNWNVSPFDQQTYTYTPDHIARAKMVVSGDTYAARTTQHLVTP